MRTVTIAIVSHFLLLLSACYALTYVPMTDFALTVTSDAIILGQVIQQSQSQRPTTNYAFTTYLIQVQESIKGNLNGVLTVEVPGGINPQTQETLIIPGGPQFTLSDTVLLFLKRVGDSWALNQLSLGEFYILEEPVSGTQFAVRPADLRTTPSARVLAPFLAWLRFFGTPARSTTDGNAGGGGVMPPDNYTVTVDYKALQQLRGYQEMSKRYRLFTYAGKNIRWFDFDGGASVIFRTDNSGQPGFPGGGMAEVDKAMAAWNNAPGVRVSYRREGTTNATTGLWSSDGVNSILFNDPSEYIQGAFDCASGGFLAFAGYWTKGETAVYRNVTYVKITEADLVVQNGIQCWWQSMPLANASLNLQSLYAHELGHTLGLAHSCNTDEMCSAAETNALMNAYIHTDGRGAALAADDIQAIQTLYGAKPTIPVGLTVVSTTSTSISLDWADNPPAETVDRYQVYLSPDGDWLTKETWISAPTGASDPTSSAYTVTGLVPGKLYQLRVSAHNSFGYGDWTDVVSATTLTSLPGDATPVGSSAVPTQVVTDAPTTPPPTTTTAAATAAPTAAPTSQATTATPITPPPQTFVPGLRATIPGRVEFENFDLGGEGVGYHDTEPQNLGGEYRLAEGVDIGSIPGGYSVGWTKEGEWLRYSISVTFSGWYIVRVRAASPNRDGQGRILIELTPGDGVSMGGVSQQLVTPDSQTWDSWVSAVTTPIPLTAGSWTLTVRMLAISNFSNAVGNFDYLHFHLLQPFGGQLESLPTTLTAANFDYGGEGIAYHIMHPSASARRPDATVELTADGSAVVLNSTEWLQLSAAVSVAGYYTIRLQASSSNPFATVRISMDDNTLVDIPLSRGSVSSVPIAYTNAHQFRVEVLPPENGGSSFVTLQSVTFDLEPPADGSLFLKTSAQLERLPGSSLVALAFSGATKLMWTATGLSGTFNSQATKFSLQVDAQYATNNALIAEISYDFNGDGKFDRVEQYQPFILDSIAMVYDTYTEQVGTQFVRGASFPVSMRNGSVRLRLWNARGASPSYVRVNNNALAASVVLIPYQFSDPPRVSMTRYELV